MRKGLQALLILLRGAGMMVAAACFRMMNKMRIDNNEALSTVFFSLSRWCRSDHRQKGLSTFKYLDSATNSNTPCRDLGPNAGGERGERRRKAKSNERGPKHTTARREAATIQ